MKIDANGMEIAHHEIQQCTCKENLCNSPPREDGTSDLIPNSAASIINVYANNVETHLIAFVCKVVYVFTASHFRSF